MDSFDTDHELMFRAGKADMQAYRELVARHLTLSVRFAQRMVGNRQDAEDIVQEAFFKVWKQAPSWQAKAKFSTWLYRVIYNACIDHKRKILPFANVEMETLEDTAPLASDVMEKDEQVRGVQNALAQLPERQRAALVLSYYEELSNQEAADILCIALGAFQQLLFRARASLREQLIGTEMEQKNG